MAIKYTNIFDSEVLQIYPNLGMQINVPSGNPADIELYSGPAIFNIRISNARSTCDDNYVHM
jgi:hypothetical protein